MPKQSKLLSAPPSRKMSFTENLRKIITKAKGTLKIQRFTGGEQRAALRAPLLHSSGSIRRILFAVAFSCASFRSSRKSAWDFHSLLRSLPSCARLSRARTMSLHRRLIPFRVRVPFHLSKKKNSACSTLFFIWRRTWDSNPRGCYTLTRFPGELLSHSVNPPHRFYIFAMRNSLRYKMSVPF